MVKVERSFPAPVSLALEAQKANGSYSKPDVVKQKWVGDLLQKEV